MLAPPPVAMVMVEESKEGLWEGRGGGERRQLWFAKKAKTPPPQKNQNGVTANTTIHHGNATPGHHLTVCGKTLTHSHTGQCH